MRRACLALGALARKCAAEQPNGTPLVVAKEALDMTAVTRELSPRVHGKRPGKQFVFRACQVESRGLFVKVMLDRPQ